METYNEGERMKVIIPDKLKIGVHIYSVELRNDYQEMENFCGSTSKQLLKIIIDNSPLKSHSLIEEYYIHELLHALFTQAGYNKNSSKEFATTEEELVERLTPVLHQILCDNRIQGDIEPLHLSSPYVF